MSRIERECKKGRLSKEELASDERPFRHIADKWMATIGRHYDEYRRKLLKMYQLREESTENLDDVINDTLLLCYDAISRNGLKDTTEQGQLNYFFRALRMNKNVKSNYDQRKDPNVDATLIRDNEVEDTDTDNDIKRDFYLNYIFNKIEENFDTDTFNIYKYKLLNNITYKKLREIYPNVDKQKSRINAVNDFIKTISPEELENGYDAYQNNFVQ